MFTVAMELLGLAIFITEIVSAIKNIKFKKATVMKSTWKRSYWWSWAVGIPLAVSSVFMIYKITSDSGETYSIIGLPFFAGAFNSKGADFVSPLTPLFMLANIIFWLLIPQLYMWVWSFRIKGENAA